MSSISLLSSPNFLRNVLRVDALSCVACGLLQLAVPGTMAEWLRLPEALLVYTGGLLLVYAALVAFISTRLPIPRSLVWLLVAGNLGWAAGCVLLLVGGSASPSMLGVAYGAFQALTVAVLAELQFSGLGRMAPQPTW